MMTIYMLVEGKSGVCTHKRTHGVNQLNDKYICSWHLAFPMQNEREAIDVGERSSKGTCAWG